MRSTGRPVYRLYTWLWSSLDWVYPPMCGGCYRPGSRWCEDCQQKATLMPVICCDQCGMPIRGVGLCSKCRETQPRYHALRSWAVFCGPVRNVLHKLKYKRDIALGQALAQSLVGLYRNLNWGTNLVIPVPLSSKRYAERGYNQAAFLARPLAMACGIDYAAKGLEKIKETPSQVDLSLENRRLNVLGAFRARKDVVSGKLVLLVDDVATTGSTLDACAAALLEAGASQVDCLTLARAV